MEIGGVIKKNYDGYNRKIERESGKLSQLISY